MFAVRDNLAECLSALRAHKLRASLTMLGLTMGVATLITVMTIVQGANVYVEQKIANLGTNVFQIARTPFAVTDFNIIIKALKYRKIELEDMQAVAAGCPSCEEVMLRAAQSNPITLTVSACRLAQRAMAAGSCAPPVPRSSTLAGPGPVSNRG